MEPGPVNLLPPRLAAASLSRREIVLSYFDSLEAIDHLNATGHVVFCWEGWERFSDGRLGHSRRYQGMVEVTRTLREAPTAFALRAATEVKASMAKAHEEWTRNPATTDSTLFFCLSVVAADAEG